MSLSSSSRYGDIPANNLLMRECQKTSNNVAARLAVIPLVQVLPLIHICLFSIENLFTVTTRKSWIFSNVFNFILRPC